MFKNIIYTLFAEPAHFHLYIYDILPPSKTFDKNDNYLRFNLYKYILLKVTIVWSGYKIWYLTSGSRGGAPGARPP